MIHLETKQCGMSNNDDAHVNCIIMNSMTPTAMHITAAAVVVVVVVVVTKKLTLIVKSKQTTTTT